MLGELQFKMGRIFLGESLITHMHFLLNPHILLRMRTCKKHMEKTFDIKVFISRAAKSFDKQAIRLAVIAHIRHAETRYDFLLAKGYDRFDARAAVKDSVDQILMQWREIVVPHFRNNFLH